MISIQDEFKTLTGPVACKVSSPNLLHNALHATGAKLEETHRPETDIDRCTRLLGGVGAVDIGICSMFAKINTTPNNKSVRQQAINTDLVSIHTSDAIKATRAVQPVKGWLPLGLPSVSSYCSQRYPETLYWSTKFDSRFARSSLCSCSAADLPGPSTCA